MSNVEYYTHRHALGRARGLGHAARPPERGRERSQPDARFGLISGMIETAENLAKRVRHLPRGGRRVRRCAATSAPPRPGRPGKFDDEVVPVAVPQKKGDAVDLRQATRACAPTPACETLGRAARRREGRHRHRRQRQPAERCGRRVPGGGRGQAGRAGPRADGLSRRLGGGRLPSRDDGHRPGAGGAAGCSQRTGLGLDDMDLVELNEAFACQVLAVLKGWGWNDPDRLNVNGSGISLGHPIGATGVRILDDAAARTASGAKAATAWRPCASAAARGSRRFSSGHERQQLAERGHDDRAVLS